MLPTINGRTLEGNCDLCFLKGAKQVYSIIASDRPKAEWWARMESSVVSGSKSPVTVPASAATAPATSRCLTTLKRNSICSPTLTSLLSVFAVTSFYLKLLLSQ